MILRRYIQRDLEEIVRLYYETVHTINAGDYTPEQLDAWTGSRMDREAWDASLRSHHSLVAEKAGKIIGFDDMDTTGYLDRLYVHKDSQWQGVASALCGCLEEWVWEKGGRLVTTQASITARPFFERRGYCLLREQQVERQGLLLTNYVMEKRLEDKKNAAW